MPSDGPGELTHKSVENYLSKGRHMQSVYVCGHLYRFFQRLGTLLILISRWRGARPDKNAAVPKFR